MFCQKKKFITVAIVLALSIILVLYSCEGSLTDPLQGFLDERILFIHGNVEVNEFVR